MKRMMLVCGAALATLVAAPVEAQSTLPEWRLVTSRDSFVVNIRGVTQGYMVLATERTADGFRITEMTRIGDAVRQDTEVLLDAGQRMVSTRQDGRMQGRDALTDLRYAGGRVKGSVLVPGAGSTTPVEIDAAVPHHVIDDNLLQSVLSALPWSAGASYIVPVFSAGMTQYSGGSGGLRDVRLSVVGIDRVTVPAGTFDAYRIEMRDGVAEVDFHVSTAAPHRLLKIEPLAVPFEMVLVM